MCVCVCSCVCGGRHHGCRFYLKGLRCVNIIIVHEEKVSSRHVVRPGPSPRPLAFLLDALQTVALFAKASRIDALWLLLPSVGEATSTCADGCGHSSRAMKR